MADIQTAYAATAQILKVHLPKNNRSGISYGKIGVGKITRAKAAEIAKTNGIELYDFLTLYKLNQLAGADGKIVVSDQLTAIDELEKILPQFFIDSQISGETGTLTAKNCHRDTLTIFDDHLILQTLGVTFEITLDIDEKVFIEELRKVRESDDYDADDSEIKITGKSGTTYRFHASTYVLFDSVDNDEVVGANVENAAEDTAVRLKFHILARRNSTNK